MVRFRGWLELVCVVSLAWAVAALVSGCGSKDSGESAPAPSLQVPPSPGAAAPATSEPEPSSPSDSKPSTSEKAPPKPKKPETPTEVNHRVNAFIKNNVESHTKIAPQKTEGWAPSSASASQLASQMDAALRSLKQTGGEIDVNVETPYGAGVFTQTLRVKDAKQFVIPFVAMQTPPVDSVVVSNGSHKMLNVGKTWYPEQAVNAPTKVTIGSPAAMVKQWNLEFPHLVFQGLTDDKPTLTPVINEWLRGNGGYDVKVEERHLPFTSPINHKVYDEVDYRILAKRAPAEAKRLGDSEVEIVVDKYHHLPVTIRARWSAPEGNKKYSVMWSCAYAFRQKFTSKDFPGPFKK